MSITWSVRTRLLLIPFAAAALTVGCGEGQILQSPTGPSGVAGSGTFLTDDAADAGVAAAASTDDFGTLAKGGNGKGGGKKPENSGGGPGRSHEDRVVGFVSAKAGSTLTVNGITVSAAPDAVIRHGHREMTMAQIGIGDHIQARGAMEGTNLVAIEIKVQNTNGEDDNDSGGTAAPLEGTISVLTPAPICPAVTFMIGTTKVTTSAATTFDDVDCAALANGALVEVTGTTAADGSIVATKVEAQAGPDEVTGFVFELAGTATCGTATQLLTFKVGATALTATAVKATPTTVFTGVTCAALAIGANVEVEGTKQADGSITAASVELH
jgi:hypothetical protein